MLSPVPNSRRALAPQTLKLSCARARNDEIGFLRHAVLEYSSALEHKAARFPRNLPDDPLEADERGRAVAAVHHQVLDLPLARDVAGERLRDGGPSQLWLVLALTVGLLVPALDRESGVRNDLHVPTSVAKSSPKTGVSSPSGVRTGSLARLQGVIAIARPAGSRTSDRSARRRAWRPARRRTS